MCLKNIFILFFRLTKSPSKTRFTDQLTAAMGKRKNKYKEITEELNQRINKEETEELFERPIINKERVKKIMSDVVDKYVIVKDEDVSYDPTKNLKLCQSVSKVINNKLKTTLKMKRYEEESMINICKIIKRSTVGPQLLIS